MKKIDLAAYTVDVRQTPRGLLATVHELPGCIAAAATVSTMDIVLQQAIFLYLDDHPDAPAYYAD